MKIVLVTGVWDLMHDGHVTYLENAAKLGDVLFVGVDTDALVRSGLSAKDAKRPILNEGIRLRTIAALACVDHAFLFDDLEELVTLVWPDLIVVSSTSKGDPELKRFDHLPVSDIEIRPVPSVSPTHTSGIIQDIVAKYGPPATPEHSNGA